VTAAIVYLHDGLVYASREECELGLEHAAYEIVEDERGRRAEFDGGGVRWRSFWLWDADAKKPFGAVPFVADEPRTTRRNRQPHVD
jgi:hypothetical protein